MADDQLLEPVLNDKGEPCWLTKKVVKYTPEDARTVKEILKDPKSHEELPDKAVFELKPEGLWQCQKCGCQIISNPDPPMECYKESGGCDRVTKFIPITKIINPDLWKIPLWKDIPVEDLDMLNTYNDAVDLCKKCLVFVEDIQYKIYVLWIFSTYKLECWNTVGTPFFVGLHTSGKTKGLDLIRELAWRMIHASNCSFVAMVRASHVFSAGVLIDEVEDKLTHKTERGQEMIEFLKPGYRKGSKYTVGDKEDPLGLISYKNYGFKALAGEILRDKAMLSRCIPFDMEKDYPEIEDIRKSQEDFDRIQTILLNYKYKTNDPPELPDDFVLHGRIREIFESIVRTGMHLGLDVTDVIEYAQRYEQEQMVEFQNSVEREILQTIWNFETQETLDDAPETLYQADICEKLGWEDPKQKAQLGYILKGRAMGLMTYRDKHGKKLKLQDPKTRRKLTYLYKRYGVTNDV